MAGSATRVAGKGSRNRASFRDLWLLTWSAGMYEVREQDFCAEAAVLLLFTPQGAHLSLLSCHTHKLGVNSRVNNLEIITHTHKHTVGMKCQGSTDLRMWLGMFCQYACTCCYKCIERKNVNMLLLKWCLVMRDLVGCAVLSKRSEEIWILYTLYMWHYYRGLRSGIWDVVRRQWGYRCQTVHTYHSSTPDLFDTHPQPPTRNLLAWGLRCREGQEVALLKCFCHKLVNLFHVFVRRWNPVLMCLACHLDISRSLQTIRRCWTYFKSVCLDWQDTVGKDRPEIKESRARTGLVFQDHAVCFWLGLFPEESSHHHSVTGIKSDTTVNGISTFRLKESCCMHGVCTKT